MDLGGAKAHLGDAVGVGCGSYVALQVEDKFYTRDMPGGLVGLGPTLQNIEPGIEAAEAED